jgi:hypothetical protein
MRQAVHNQPDPFCETSMRIGHLPAYYHDTKETLGVVMILIVPVVAPVLMLLLLGRLLHGVDRGAAWLVGRR